MAYRKRAKSSYRSSAPKRKYKRKATRQGPQRLRIELVHVQPQAQPVPVIGGEFALPASNAKKSKL